MDVASPIASSTAGQSRADADRCFTITMGTNLATKWASDGTMAAADASGGRAVPHRGADRPPATGYGQPA
ncbi:hypothetical protein SAMN06269185_1085 [Natronoarchaeum philippinense]|uniref:Uncharacterized protein n=1 Tax=Natronoarchaeum philippinense TaxID=558529 RepID=A0A285NBB6_NATPI|nr:hypothetical protein [Natronoarchaeum philippinense]SNZ06203.1 hypothetical protein SAMN06269185_1085 [Natronoarchaeum philippinense]